MMEIDEERAGWFWNCSAVRTASLRQEIEAKEKYNPNTIFFLFDVRWVNPRGM